MDKRAETSQPIHDLLALRWSPRAFDARDVDPALLTSLFEAARWAPSCFNEQPWRFFVATRGDAAAFERLGACLMDGNAWARSAAVLFVAVARTTFERNDRPNRHAWHDVGAAVLSLALQAESHGLATHQMAGFDAEKARAVLGLPEDHEAVSMVAVGYPGDPAALPEALAERERAPRTRRPLDTIVFGAGWDQPFAQP